MEVTFNEEWALTEAVKAAINSNCKSKRGVAIWSRKDGLITTGYNRPPKPFICDGSDACRANCAKTAVHAEQAALMKIIQCPSFIMLGNNDLEMIHVKVVDGQPVVSEKPSCWQCSKLILEAGIKYMWLYQAEGFVRYTAEEFHEKTLINCDLKQTQNDK